MIFFSSFFFKLLQVMFLELRVYVYVFMRTPGREQVGGHERFWVGQGHQSMLPPIVARVVGRGPH